MFSSYLLNNAQVRIFDNYYAHTCMCACLLFIFVPKMRFLQVQSDIKHLEQTEFK